MYINTTGLVLRETAYKDSSKILTVLTSTHGKLTVSARGAMRRNSRLAASAQPLAYSHMTLCSSRERWTLTEASPIELFPGLSADIRLLALGSYFAELLEAVSDEDCPNPEILSLGLNALFLLSENQKDMRLVKAAFEIRLMSLAGYEPEAAACAVCSKTDIEAPCLDLLGGVVCCRGCLPSDAQSAALCPGSLDALRYITSAEAKRCFSFRLEGDALERLAEAAEAYATAQLDRRFRTLDYYRSLE